jgi:hypothetical protein
MKSEPPAARTPVDVLVLGTVVRIVVPGHAVRERVLHAWRQCLAEPGAPVDATVSAGTPRDGTEETVARVMQSLTQSVTAAAIRTRAGSLVMLHAAALCDQSSGATVAVVAPGGTGKTTVVRTLGKGRGYITDETVGIDRHGVVVPYLKPLSVRRPEPPSLKDEIPADELGLEVPRVQPWLAALVILRRDLEAGSRVEVEEVDLLDALVMLAPETSSLAALERPLHALASLVERAGGLRVARYHDAADLEPLVASLIGRP